MKEKEILTHQEKIDLLKSVTEDIKKLAEDLEKSKKLLPKTFPGEDQKGDKG